MAEVDVCRRARWLLCVGANFARERKYPYAAKHYQSWLTMIEIERKDLNYTAKHVLSVKFALACCYFYADEHHKRNLQLLKELQHHEIPAVDYITAAIYYKLNKPFKAMEYVERGLNKISKCTDTVLHYWPETNLSIKLSEKKYLKPQLEELKGKIELPLIVFSSSSDSEETSNQMLGSVRRSKFNASAPTFHPGTRYVEPASPAPVEHRVLSEDSPKLQNLADEATVKVVPKKKQESSSEKSSVTKQAQDGIKPTIKSEVNDLLKKHNELLQKLCSEQQIAYNDLKRQMESQCITYQKKIKGMYQRIKENVILTATLLIKKKPSQDTMKRNKSCTALHHKTVASSLEHSCNDAELPTTSTPMQEPVQYIIKQVIKSESNDQLQEYNEHLERKYFKQEDAYKELESQIELQFITYEDKIKELEQMIEEDDEAIATFLIREELLRDSTEFNKTEIKIYRSENKKLHNITVELTENIFTIQFAISKSNEKHCLKELNALKDAYSNVCPPEIMEEINAWKTELEKVIKHKGTLQNMQIMLSNNASDDVNKLLNGFSEAWICFTDKRNRPQSICLNIKRAVESAPDSGQH